METLHKECQSADSLITIKDSYCAPHIEVIVLTLERGFADSSEDFGDGSW